LREHFGFIDQSLNSDLNDIQATFIESGHKFFIADHDGQVVGTVGLLIERGNARIVRMSVLKDYRQRGIASALLGRCFEAAKAEGFTEIVAYTEPQWADAVGFYTARGFRQYDRDEIDIHLRRPL
jgi:N-acetylglutamate synthase-like GNAT family acetyltransferase